MTINALNTEPLQIQLFVAQVWRNGNWRSLPVTNATGNLQIGAASTVTLEMTLDETDPQARLYEGERVRMYRGLWGEPIKRCFTGFVDAPTAVNSVSGTKRTAVISDHFKELKDAKLLEPRVYDDVEPNTAILDCIAQAIQTAQLKLYSDNGQALVDTFGYDTDTNPIIDAPRIFNDDGSTYFLPQGTLASTMTVQGASASIAIPPASGTTPYIALQLPYGFIIASTMTANLTLSGAANFPPASGSYFLDFYNGIAYFNPVQQSGNFTFSCYRYDSPLFGYQLGTSIGDVIQAICDKTGQHFITDDNGRFHVVAADKPRVPTRILGKDQYIQNSIQTNRDRSNVIICEGWDGNCNALIASKAVLLEDTLLAPPQGLGKRSYLIVQDPTWQTQYAANKAAYYAAKQIGRRGKIMSLTILDDPTVEVDSTIAFIGTFGEVSVGDLFIVEQVNWQIGMQNGQLTSQSVVSGTLLQAQGTIYLGPASAVTGAGNVDYSIDATPIYDCNLSPPGGHTGANFSIATGLQLQFNVSTQPIQENIDIYGSDGSHYVAENNIVRNGNARYSLPLPSAAFKPGLFYVIEFWALDPNGNVGAYRDCITALP